MTRFPYALDLPVPKRLGLIVLQSDETVEQDFRRLMPASAALLVSRVPSGRAVTRETLAAMEHDLPSAAGLFPHGLAFDAVGYGCTSGTSVIGQDRVAALVRQGTQATAVTEPVSAVLAACRTLGIARLAFLSPYIEEVSEGLRTILANNGIETPVFGSFNEAEEAKVARIGADSVREAALTLAAASEADAVFLSCTNLPTLDVIAAIEAASGKPVLSSNQVLAWHLARLANAGPLPAGFGMVTGRALAA